MDHPIARVEQRSPREAREEDISRMRIRFEDEMKQVESQMGHMRREFEGPGSRAPDLRQEPIGPMVRHEPQPPKLQTPLIRDCSDATRFCLQFDVVNYLPEEISVKTVDDKLQVRAKHQERNKGRNMFCEFNQDFQLPRNVDPYSITSSLSTDGILTVEGPKLNVPPPRAAIEDRRSPRS